MILRLVVAGLFAVGLSSCTNPIAFASKRPVSLAYVGAFTFGPLEQMRSSVVVPLVVDYRSGEWMMNSGLAAYDTVARVDDKQITFFVRVSLPSERRLLKLRLPKLAMGDYTMIYADPDGTKHPVGSIKIE